MTAKAEEGAMTVKVEEVSISFRSFLSAKNADLYSLWRWWPILRWWWRLSARRRRPLVNIQRSNLHVSTTDTTLDDQQRDDEIFSDTIRLLRRRPPLDS